jgi:hypothetical protein
MRVEFDYGIAADSVSPGFAKILNLYRFILRLESNAVQLMMNGVFIAAFSARKKPSLY